MGNQRNTAYDSSLSPPSPTPQVPSPPTELLPQMTPPPSPTRPRIRMPRPAHSPSPSLTRSISRTPPISDQAITTNEYVRQLTKVIESNQQQFSALQQQLIEQRERDRLEQQERDKQAREEARRIQEQQQQVFTQMMALMTTTMQQQANTQQQQLAREEANQELRRLELESQERIRLQELSHQAQVQTRALEVEQEKLRQASREQELQEAELESQRELLSISTPTHFEAAAKDLFAQRFPTQYKRYEQLYASNPMFARMFTIQIDGGEPMFIPPNNTLHVLDKKRAYYTPYVWFVLLDESQRENIRVKFTTQERFRENQLSYVYESATNLTTPAQFYALATESTSIDRNIRQADNRMTTAAIKNIRLSNIQHDTSAILSPMSVSRAQYLDIEDKIMEDDLIDADMRFDRYKFFNGIAYEYVVRVNNPYNSNDLETTTLTARELSDLFTAIVVRSVRNILVTTHPNYDELYVNVVCQYVNTKDDNIPLSPIQDHNQEYVNKMSPPVKELSVVKGKKLSEIQDSNFHIASSLEDQLELLQSGTAGLIEGYILNPYQFSITIIDIIAGGTLLANLSRLDEAMLDRKDKVVRLDWGVVKNYASKKNGCLIKILHMVIKSPSYATATRIEPPTYNTYLKLWESLDLRLGLTNYAYSNAVTIEDADKYAQALHLKLYVYGVDGTLIYESSSKYHPIRVMYKDGHYFHVVERFPQGDKTQEKVIFKKGSKKAYYEEFVPMFFDYETIYDTSVASNNSLTPYSASWTIMPPVVDDYGMLPEDGFVVNDNPFEYETVTSTMLASIQNVIGKWSDYMFRPRIPKSKDEDVERVLDGQIVVVNVLMIAYNGSGFDFHLLFKYLALQGYKINRPPMNGKISAMTANLFSMRSKTKSKDILYVNLSVWDPYLYLIRSLDSAASAFKLDTSKEVFNHEEVQQAYNEGTLSEWLSDNKSMLENYNNKDVDLLRQITQRLTETLIQLTSLNPYKYPTLPALSYAYWSRLPYMGNHKINAGTVFYKGGDPEVNNLVRGNITPPLYASDSELSELEEVIKNSGYNKEYRRFKNKDVCIPPRSVKIDSAIRTAIIGGRVEGIANRQPHRANTVRTGTKIIDPFVMVDVTSEYPYVMMSEGYPIGEAIEVYEAKSVISYYTDPRYIGLYYCEVDQSTLYSSLNHPILPYRDKNGRLNWKLDVAKNYKQVGWIPDVTIRQLVKYGAKVTPLADENRDKLCAIIWIKSEPGAVFRYFIQSMGSIKSQQDNLARSNNDEYNPALREMSKLLMNSLSGKVVQRLHYKKSEYFTDKEQDKLVKRIDILKSQGESYEAEIISGKMIRLTYRKEPRLVNCPQLGVFIYGYARAYMYEHIFSKVLVYYSDTDSAVIRESALEVIKRQKLPGTNRGIVYEGEGDKVFGMLEIEGRFSNIQVLAPKSYICYNTGLMEDGTRGLTNIVKLRMKGISSRDYIALGEGSNWIPYKGNEYRLFYYLRDNDEFYAKSWTFFKRSSNITMKRVELVKIVRVRDSDEYVDNESYLVGSEDMYDVEETVQACVE